MKRLRLVCLLMLVACGGGGSDQPTTPAPSPPPPAPDAGGATYGALAGDEDRGDLGAVDATRTFDPPLGSAKAECDALVAAYEAFAMCKSLPPDIQQALQANLQTVRDSFAAMGEVSGEAAVEAATGCRDGAVQIAQSAKESGC